MWSIRIVRFPLFVHYLFDKKCVILGSEQKYFNLSWLFSELCTYSKGLLCLWHQSVLVISHAWEWGLTSVSSCATTHSISILPSLSTLQIQRSNSLSMCYVKSDFWCLAITCNVENKLTRDLWAAYYSFITNTYLLLFIVLKCEVNVFMLI